MAMATAEETARAETAVGLPRRAKLRNLHEAVMLEDAAAVLRRNRATVDAHAKANLDGYETPADDEMRVDSPNTTTINHHHPAPAKAGMGTLAKLAAAGLIASGVGLPIGAGLAAPAVLDYLKPDAVTVEDTDSVLGVGLGRPPKGAE